MITITGRIPSKKNSRNIFYRSGRIHNTPNAKYQAWHKQAIVQLPKIGYVEVKRIILDFYFPDLRRADLTNKAESVMDLLVDAKIIEDDNWKVVPEIRLRSQGLDRENPRVEILIYGLEDVNGN